jgi:hypothetical protein
MSAPGRGEVFIDGQKVKRVTEVLFSSGVDKSNQVTLTVSADKVEIEGRAFVAIDETSIESTEREFKAA